MLGIIGTDYNAGISHIAWSFAEQFNAKTLLVHHKNLTSFPERFKNRRITKSITREDIDWLLDGIDTLFTIETPYDWTIYAEAKKRGIKTVLMPMYEWLPKARPELKDVDLFVCPSIATYENLSGNKILVPSEVPVDTDKFTPREVKKAKIFLHISGHGGIQNRNSTPELLQAIPKVKSDVIFIINSQYPINKINDSRVIIQDKNFENYWDMYDDGDVWLMPAKYGVAFLGIGESMATGMIPSITDMHPFNKYLDKEFLVKPSDINTVPLFFNQPQLHSSFRPDELANEIDRIAQLDLSRHSARSLEMANEWSWKVWKPKYEEIFSK